MTRMYLIGIASLALIAAEPAGSDRDPGGYAVRLRVVPAAGGGVQRVALPAAAIVALRNRDSSDLRVFDARGRTVPIARIAASTEVRRDRLDALPILGDRDTRMGARVSVRLDERGQARVAEVESGTPVRNEVASLGVLLDARRTRGTADRLDFDADIPVGRPVRFTVEASRDLDGWRTLGERTLYRAPGAPVVGARIPLGSAALDGDYLRISWRPAAPVTVRSVALVSTSAANPIVVAARSPALVDDHTVEFVTPASALSTLRVVPRANDGAIAVRILGRDDAERPWTVLASGVASRDRSAIDLDESPRVIRIEADRRGAAFSAAPAVELGFAPQAVAIASAPAPYVLAAGRAGAADAFVPLDALSPTGDLPEATIDHAPIPASIMLAAPDDSRNSGRRAVLWSVLLGAVAVLAALVWWSMRRPAPAT